MSIAAIIIRLSMSALKWQAATDIPLMNARGLGVTLTGFAHMNFRLAEKDMLEAIAQRIEETLPDFVPNTFGNVVWSLHIITDLGSHARPCFPVLQQVKS